MSQTTRARSAGSVSADGSARAARAASGPGDTDGADPTTAAERAGIPHAFAGEWRGHIAPTAGLLASEYDIEIELRRGAKSGKWKEPANSCVGTLRLTGASDSALILRLEDVAGCVPGDVVLVRKGDALAYRHTDDFRVMTYEGRLTRDS
ncbi:hypothetical protein AB0O28_34425 [Microbispora sp. NPDC088329]|uniref:hypothetical protein n=1 Tax=Microbispora sp. NPDC088329 TaxID=3154869 RepID=UPI0034281E6F